MKKNNTNKKINDLYIKLSKDRIRDINKQIKEYRNIIKELIKKRNKIKKEIK